MTPLHAAAVAPVAHQAAIAAGPRPSGDRTAAAAPAPQAQEGFVDFFGYAAAAGGWLFCGWSAQRWEEGEGAVAAHFEQARVSAETIACWHERPDLGGAGMGVVAFLKAPGRSLGNFRGLEVRAGAHRLRLPANRPLVHLREAELLPRARQLLLAAEGEHRARLLGLLSRRPYLGQDTLADLPVPVQVEVDEAILAPPDGVVLVGWCLDPTESVASIRVRSGGMLASAPVAERWLRTARPDVVGEAGPRLGVTDPRCGFVAYAPACCAAEDAAAAGGQQLHLEVELKGGEIGYKRLPAPKLSGTAAVRRVLESVRLSQDEIAPAFDRVLGPPLAAINRARLARPRPHAVVGFGAPNPEPVCSVIVPLYGRMDFVTYQLALMSVHGGTAAHELVYVLDEPARKQELLDLAHSAHRRFGLPFRVVALEENLGYGPANNVGLSHARGEFICFLNSDVMPADEPRWLDLMLDDLRADPTLGVVGARLLFEDGTVQHDGMSFERLPQLADWPFPMHPGKGRLPRGEAALADAEAVTGACMVLRADLARELSGFDEDYAIGDFEDTDLCLRIRRKGLRCAVERRARLFHLERQSQVTPDRMWRFYVTLLNAWTHTRRWFPEQTGPGGPGTVG
jgi:GT2 family glycosyltransferase